MRGILFLAVVALLAYAIAIEPRRIAKLMRLRLSTGDVLPYEFNCQEIFEMLQTATWIRDKKEVKLSDPEADGKSGLIKVICKGITYQVRISSASYKDDSSKLIVTAVDFQSKLWGFGSSWNISEIRYLQEANRIRCRIMERAAPGFTEKSSQYNDEIKMMYFLRYCAIALIAAFCCYVLVPKALESILGADSVQNVHVLGMSVAVILFIYSGVALSPYIIKTRSEKLLDGVQVPQYLSNDELMDLLRDKLHLKVMQSLYFDETGSVAIKGKYSTYVIKISSECMRLFVMVQGSKAEAYQEGDYIQCSIVKLFNSAHPENPEEIRQMLGTIRTGRLMARISVLAFIALIAAPFLLNQFGSKGIASSYLTQYSETVTVGDAFGAFFADPKWESYKIGGQEYVDFTGKCTYLDEEAVMRITFSVFDDRFNVSNIAVNGIDMSPMLWPKFLDVIYSSAEDTSPAATVPSRNENTSDVPKAGTSFATEPPQASASQAGIYDDFVGTWQDEDGYGNYLFIGYADKSKNQVYARVSTAADDFEAELTLDTDGHASGYVMGGGSEPLYLIDIDRDKYWLETVIYYGEYNFSDFIKFVPADPATCPYANPYYTG